MGLMNWLMKGVGFENEEVYDDSYERQQRREEKLNQQKERRLQKQEDKRKKAQERADKAAKKYDLRQEKDVPVKPQSTMTSYTQNPEQYNTQSYSAPVNNYGIGSNVGGYGTKNVEFLFPTRYDEVQSVINYLKEGETVMLNLNNMNEIDAQRLLDSASGAIYALNGSIRHVDNNIFLLTPQGFNIRTPENSAPNNGGQGYM